MSLPPASVFFFLCSFLPPTGSLPFPFTIFQPCLSFFYFIYLAWLLSFLYLVLYLYTLSFVSLFPFLIGFTPLWTVFRSPFTFSHRLFIFCYFFTNAHIPCSLSVTSFQSSPSVSLFLLLTVFRSPFTFFHRLFAFTPPFSSHSHTRSIRRGLPSLQLAR